MKKILLFICCFSSAIAWSQEDAWQRSAQLGWGMNLSWLEHWWLGTAENNYTDYLDMDKLDERRSDIALIAELGFETVRLPVAFNLWDIDQGDYFKATDSLINWCLSHDLNVIIDYQYGAMYADNYKEEAERIADTWTKIARRYSALNPEKLYFELYNEPNNFPADIWIDVANEMVKAIRTITTDHSIIVGGVDWNSIYGLQAMLPIDDDNIIYTFHYYEPLIFTHQGADWMTTNAGNPVATTGVPFPHNPLTMPDMHPDVGDSWGMYEYEDYDYEGSFSYMEEGLVAAKDWSIKHNVPIFCGEWGSYDPGGGDWEDRCRYTRSMLYLLDSLSIPFCYWEWDREFKIFDGEPSFENMPDCMQSIWNSEREVLSPDWQFEAVKIFPNPAKHFLTIKQSEQYRYDRLVLYNSLGQQIQLMDLDEVQVDLDVGHLSTGVYIIHFVNSDVGIKESIKFMKN